MMFDTQYEILKNEIESALERACDTPDLDPAVGRAMRYSLLGGGKRVRGALAVQFCRMCDGDPNVGLGIACAVEMIHAFSLIHDDLPCMDNDDYRRGKLSCHKKFGEAVALLAGDALLCLAFQTLADVFDGPEIHPDTAKVISLFAKASGAGGMIAGQSLDMEGSADTEELLREMSLKKTGKLIEAAVLGGCFAGRADRAKKDAAGRFARDIGLAFQIKDDILDVTSTLDTLGKAPGSDERAGKHTFATLLGADGADALVHTLSERAVSLLQTTFDDTSFMTDFVHMLMQREK